MTSKQLDKAELRLYSMVFKFRHAEIQMEFKLSTYSWQNIQGSHFWGGPL